MSMLEINLKSSSNTSLVEKILEQGQRLRNAMVQTVLNNDPFNKEVLNNHYNSPRTNMESKSVESVRCSHCDTIEKSTFSYPMHNYDRVRKYLCGEEMCKTEEVQALETLRAMSPNSLIDSSSGVKNLCHLKDSCVICKEYENKLFLESEASSTTSLNVEKPKITSLSNRSKPQKSILQNTKTNLLELETDRKSEETKSKASTKLHNLKDYHENRNVLKYVDSLKVNVYSLKLNSAGKRKISSTENISRPFLFTSTTYFVEYTLPDILTKNIKSRLKFSTGLSSDKIVKFSSKNLQNESVYFKQQNIHQISNVNMIDLNNIRIEFRVSFRSVKQKTPLLIGKANFNLGSLLKNRFFTAEQELVLMNENAPVVLGNLKISVQFGCDKIYFGKEFIDAISCSKENTNISDSDSFHKLSDSERTKSDKILKNQHEDTAKTKPQSSSKVDLKKDVTVNKIEEETHLLYALIHISEVRLLSDPINSYIICRGFNRDDTITSRVIYNDFKPFFNLYQIIPILLDDDFINRLRDNYIIVEIWEKKDADKLIGISKLSLHQLYVAYRNPAIVKHLSRNKHPVIGVDWWEPITCPISNSETGQLRALVALGSLNQIETLEENRGLRNFEEKIPPKQKVVTIVEEQKIETPISLHRDSFIYDDVVEKKVEEVKKVEEGPSRTVILVSDKYVQEPDIEISPRITPKLIKPVEICKKVDASTQSEITEMSTERDKSTSSNFSQKDIFNSFLELLSSRDLSYKNKHVENSTNTDFVPETSQQVLPVSNKSEIQNDKNLNKSSNLTFPLDSIKNTNLPVKNTSDLLDSLQKALSTRAVEQSPEKMKNDLDVNDTFKVHVFIENALHLPSRKKCKSKKNKMKSPKYNEEILPSTYVMFKDSNDSCILTPVVSKSTSPNWDFRCDINLPSELLLNNQKRLIFKVWRKANGPSLQPNFQTDIVLGFAALDLTVLLSGLPNVQGWFNIVDFSSKCNGQIKINITPLENLSKFNEYKRSCIPEKLRVEPNTSNFSLQKRPEAEITDDSAPSELLSRALKRKFTELDEITQRLRQRLSAVTNDDSDLSNDDFIDEFERDLNTVCVENEPFNIPEQLKNSTEIAADKIQNEFSSGSTTSLSETNAPTVQENLNKLDSHLTEGKLKIDSLLEKLTLLTADNDSQNKSDRSFSSRYVSGCSISHEPESSYNVLKDLEKNYVDPDLIFNPLLFQQMFTSSIDSTPRLDSLENVHCTTLKNLVQDSTSSGSSKDLQSISSTSLSDTNLIRQAPEGAGNLTND